MDGRDFKFWCLVSKIDTGERGRNKETDVYCGMAKPGRKEQEVE